MAPGTFGHEAMLYSGAAEFVGLAVSFLAPAVRAGDPALVLVEPHKQSLLREALGPAGHAVSYADVRAAGRNPAHLIPIWRKFVEDSTPHLALWGISEHMWAERSAAEVAECHQLEALLNLALADATTLTLACPVDVSTVQVDAVTAAVRGHPDVRTAGGTDANPAYELADPRRLLSEPLPAAPVDAEAIVFTGNDLRMVRSHVGAAAAALGFGPDRAADVALAVDEVATNSSRYGGGGGSLHMWAEDGGLVCEVRDGGRLSDPLVGRRRPATRQVGGRGLWIANQLCDLVQIRSTGEGTVVRLFARRSPVDLMPVT